MRMAYIAPLLLCTLISGLEPARPLPAGTGRNARIPQAVRPGASGPATEKDRTRRRVRAAVPADAARIAPVSSSTSKSRNATPPELFERTWMVDGVPRTALVHIPATAAFVATPVVFGFHGRGGNSRNAARKFALHVLWPEAIVVYPQGLPTPLRRMPQATPRPGWQQRVGDGNDRDLKFFDAMLQRLRMERRVDDRRIYVMGHSMGGAFAYLLWHTRGEVIAAIASSAGTLRNASGCTPKPFMHIAGRNDAVIPFIRQQRTMDTVRTINRCSETGRYWATSGDLVATIYSPATGKGAPFVAVIHSGTHRYRRAASALIVRFFKEHPVGRTSPNPDDAQDRPIPGLEIPPVSRIPAFVNMRFHRDYTPGTRDPAGRLRDGTEITRLLGYRGKLFAATGAWTDWPYSGNARKTPWTGPQILRKDSAGGPWRVEAAFPESVRVEALTVATFPAAPGDARRKHPLSLLVAAPSGRPISVWTRDDSTASWTRSIVHPRRRGGIRSLCTHKDSRTGITHLFCGATVRISGHPPGAIFRGTYDPDAPGRIRWNPTPELTGTGRITAITEADGVLYAACGVALETPHKGGIFRRIDGPVPRWELVWRQPFHLEGHLDEWALLRGLTAVPAPDGSGRHVLLCTATYPGVVYRIDPSARPARVSIECDIRAFLAAAWNIPYYSGPLLSAYNRMLPVTAPESGESCLLIPLWARHPGPRGAPLPSSAWFLVRHSDATYALGRIFDPDTPHPNPPRGLTAARTIEPSPFSDEGGRVLYFGGYDCAWLESHNTAWIYRGEVPLAPSSRNK